MADGIGGTTAFEHGHQRENVVDPDVKFPVT